MIVPTLWLVLSAASHAVLAAPSAPAPPSPLPAADCIQTDRINDWQVVDARTAIVRTGPKYYRVALRSDCPQLSHPPGLIFGTSNRQGVAQGRICGSVGETVHSRGQPPCAIESVRVIDKSRYDQLSDAATRYRKGVTNPKQ